MYDYDDNDLSIKVLFSALDLNPGPVYDNLALTIDHMGFKAMSP